MIIGLPYEDFYQVEDEEVIELLERLGRAQEECKAAGPHRQGAG